MNDPPWGFLTRQRDSYRNFSSRCNENSYTCDDFDCTPYFSLFMALAPHDTYHTSLPHSFPSMLNLRASLSAIREQFHYNRSLFHWY